MVRDQDFMNTSFIYARMRQTNSSCGLGIGSSSGIFTSSLGEPFVFYDGNEIKKFITICERPLTKKPYSPGKALKAKQARSALVFIERNSIQEEREYDEFLHK